MTRQFHLFGPDHLIAVAVLMVIATILIRASSRWSAQNRRLVELSVGALLVLYAATAYLERMAYLELSLASSLPLELCHIVLFATVITLFWPNDFASEIAYFLGLSGTLQAVVTPDIQQAFPSWEFLEFFWSHGLTIVAILLIVAGRGFRPSRRAIIRMLCVVNAYAVLVGLLDLAFGWNYGYLCRKPDQPSLLDYLGPWPLYLISLEVVALALFGLLVLPWELVRTPQKLSHGLHGFNGSRHH